MRRWRNWNPRIQMIGTENGTATVENSVVATQKSTELSNIPAITLLGIYTKQLISLYKCS
jgi:hypothetical protein